MVFIKDVSMLLDDYIDFNMYHGKKKILLGTLIPISVFIILMLLLGFTISIKQVAYYLFIIVILPTLTISGIISSIKKLSKKQYESSKTMQVPTTIVINNQKVNETSSFGSMMYEWNDLYQAVESKNSIYIYFSKIQAFVIPKRLLTPQEEATLRQLINENIDPKKNKLKKH